MGTVLSKVKGFDWPIGFSFVNLKSIAAVHFQSYLFTTEPPTI